MKFNNTIRGWAIITSILVFGYFNAGAQVAVPSGLVGWWAGDGDARDTAGTKNGTLQNGAGFTVGHVGQGFLLDGIDDRVVIPQTDPITSSFTVETWINPSTLGNNPVVFEKGVLINDRIGLQILGNGTLGGYMDALGGFSVSGGSIPTNTFTHVAYILDDTANTARLYVNGVQIASATETRSPTGNTGTLTLGDSPVSPLPEQFAGQIDEFSLYNRALTNAEIQSIFNAGIAGKLKQRPTIDTNSLISLWKGENNANDTRGLNNGTFAVNDYAAGRVGQAFDFGSSSPPGVVVPDNASLNPQAFTIEAWITAGTYGCPGGPNTCQGFIIDKSGSNGLFGYSIGMREAGTLRFLLNGGSGGADIITTQSVADGNFHHLVASYDGATMRVFVDGVLIAQRSVVTTINYQANSQFHIGSRQFLMTGSTVRHPGKIDEAAIYNRALSAAEVRANFEAGNALTTRVGDATITFPFVTTAGLTRQVPLDRALLPPVPFGGTAVLAYDIATTAAFTGNPTVCFNLPLFNNPAPFSELRVLHLEAGVWQNRTTTSTFATRTLCGQVTSLSPFAIATLVPTAANASISGRVVTVDGNGIAKVRVTVSGGDLPQPITIQTSPFGYYRFDGLATGQTYILEVASKRYTFSNPTRMIDLSMDAADIDFTADSP